MCLGDELHVTNSVNSQLILLSLKNLGSLQKAGALGRVL